MTLGKRIKKLRRAEDISRADFARMFGVGQGTVAYWERDAFAPRLDKLMKIAEHFGVSAEWLLSDDERQEDETAVAPALKKGIDCLSPSQQTRLLDYINSLISESASAYADISGEPLKY
jgi:transcriptional regulator with XRE-family HTH domain